MDAGDDAADAVDDSVADVNFVTPLQVVSQNKGTLRGSAIFVGNAPTLFGGKGELELSTQSFQAAETAATAATASYVAEGGAVPHVRLSNDPQFHVERHGNNESFNVELLPTRHFYEQVFVKAPHVNVVCVSHGERGDVNSVSVVTVERGGDASVKRALLLSSRKGYQTATVSVDEAVGDDAANAPAGCGGGSRRAQSPPSLEERIVERVQAQWFPRALCYMVSDAAHERATAELLRLEREAADNTANFRIGVCYCESGQTTEAEYFANYDPPAAFWDFLNVLGSEVDLFGFKGFRAQLSVTEPGRKSYYTQWRDLEIMYHTCPLLSAEEQRRLVGNDVALIYFHNGGADEVFNASCPRSSLTQLFFVVQPAGPQKYKLASMHRVALSHFPPSLPPEPVFDCSDEAGRALFKDFLLAKVMNGYRIAMQCPPLNKLFQRPRDVKLKELHERFPMEVGAHVKRPVASANAKRK